MKTRITLTIVLVLMLAAAAALAQTTGGPLPSFEVASIKLSDIHRGGAIGIFTFPGGKVTAGVFHVQNVGDVCI